MFFFFAGRADLQAQPPPANDNFATRKSLTGASGQEVGSNEGAGKEPREPIHAGDEGGASVWYSWVAPSAGTAAFHTSGSDFDTLLAVYTGTDLGSLQEAAGDDDGGGDGLSSLNFRTTAGTDYQIAIDGYGGDHGSIVLEWSLAATCSAPPAPAGPIPADQAVGVEAPPTLRWDQGPRVRSHVIYGRDDRLEIYQVTDPALLALADATVAMMYREDLRDNGNGTYTIQSLTFGESYQLCPSERFFSQLNPAICSGFLAAPDLVVTAGHCILDAEECAQFVFVFGFRMLDAATPVLTFPSSQVYSCKQIAARRLSDEGSDWGIIQLDREVPDHRPLRIRRAGRIGKAAPIFTIGYPVGLPEKLAGGATVRDDPEDEYFITTLDVYAGSSGSPVFNADTLLVEGIVVRGEEDFVFDGECFTSHVCPESECVGEDVTRTSEFDELIPANEDATIYQVFFGACGDLKLLGTTAEKSWQLEGLEPGHTYCWQIVADGECGSARGPIWSFTTAAASRFIRGDPTGEGATDVSDAVAILSYLFLGGQLGCQKAADVDDDGLLNLTDPVALLTYLFQAGPPPAPPFGACGEDLTADALTCEEFPLCR